MGSTIRISNFLDACATGTSLFFRHWILKCRKEGSYIGQSFCCQPHFIIQQSLANTLAEYIVAIIPNLPPVEDIYKFRILRNIFSQASPSSPSTLYAITAGSRGDVPGDFSPLVLILYGRKKPLSRLFWPPHLDTTFSTHLGQSDYRRDIITGQVSQVPRIQAFIDLLRPSWRSTHSVTYRIHPPLNRPKSAVISQSRKYPCTFHTRWQSLGRRGVEHNQWACIFSEPDRETHSAKTAQDIQGGGSVAIEVCRERQTGAWELCLVHSSWKQVPYITLYDTGRRDQDHRQPHDPERLSNTGSLRLLWPIKKKASREEGTALSKGILIWPLAAFRSNISRQMYSLTSVESIRFPSRFISDATPYPDCDSFNGRLLMNI